MFVDGDPHMLEKSIHLSFNPLPKSSLAKATTIVEESEEAEIRRPLGISKDGLKSSVVDMDDPHTTSIVQLFIAHNVVRRNLLACATNAKTVTESTLEAFCQYASYTTLVLEEQLDVADMIWFPAFTEYEGGFYEQIKRHYPLKAQTAKLRGMLPSEPRSTKLSNVKLDKIAAGFQELHDRVDEHYTLEEELLNRLGHRVPIRALEHLRKEQFARRQAFLAKYGQLWCAVYLSRSLLPEEHEMSPPNLPKLIAAGMMAAASLQFKKVLSFAPKHEIASC